MTLCVAVPVWRGFEGAFRGESAGSGRRLPLNDRDSLNYRSFVKRPAVRAVADHLACAAVAWYDGKASI